MNIFTFRWILLATVLFTSCDDPTAKKTGASTSVDSTAEQKYDDASGEWEVFRGKAVDTLILTNEDGILKGTLTEDIEWGGQSWDVRGMVVGDKITWNYSTKKTDSVTSDTADFLLQGKIEGKKMSGEYKLKLLCISLSDGVPTPLSSDGLWIAKRPDPNKKSNKP